MKKLIVGILMLISLQIVSGQDKIITIQQDTIFCRIVSVSSSHITDYFTMNKYYYDEIHNGRPVQAHYVFANQGGTELAVIRNATSGDFMWSLEFITVTN